MMFFPIPDDIPEVVQHYLQMWNEPDTDEIRGHIDRAVSEDCWWMNPMHTHTGRDALEDNVRVGTLTSEL
jgi:hypothetical protein